MASTRSTIRILVLIRGSRLRIPFEAAASIAMPQWLSTEFQKGITVGMNIKYASNRETGRRLEMHRYEATVLVLVRAM